MSAVRQPLSSSDEAYYTVRSIAATLATGHIIDSHTHGWSQLLCSCSGAMTVYGGHASWMVPPGYGVMIPAGSIHSIRMWGEVTMRSLYLPASIEIVEECRVIPVSPLLKELILRVIDWRVLDSRMPEHMRLLAVLLDELARAQRQPASPLLLPLPEDPRALAVALHILNEPACEDTFDNLAHRYAASRRTLERLFQRETGLSLGVWRQKARLLNSIRLLAEGRSVTNAALDSGYSSMSAFIAAFKKTFGYTPGRL